MAQSRILLVGLGGLGMETAKNLCLAGVQSVTLLDPSPCRAEDGGSNWAVDEAAVQRGLSRATASFPFLQQLNPNVRVDVAPDLSALQLLAATTGSAPSLPPFSAVVLTACPPLALALQEELNAQCRASGAAFISASASGLMGVAFVDVGPSFTVLDPTGEPLGRGLISHVSCAAPYGVVTCHEEHRHGLSDGDWVTFEEVEGMTELNASPPRAVRVLTPFSFAIEDTSAYAAFTGHRGYFQQVQRPRTVHCQGLDTQLTAPTILQLFTCEAELHALYVALDEYRKETGGQPLPAPLSPKAVARVVALVEEVGRRLSPALPPLSPSSSALLGRLARIAACELSPLCAVMGGVVGQEVLKSRTQPTRTATAPLRPLR